MNVTYDPAANALYIKFREEPVDDTIEDANGFMIDYNREGRVVGIEILNASADIDDPTTLTYATLGVAFEQQAAERKVFA
jgi:uncharacterized protein YuzE